MTKLCVAERTDAKRERLRDGMLEPDLVSNHDFHCALNHCHKATVSPHTIKVAAEREGNLP